eukprot:4346677-Amphidinium_carterae.1
MFTYHGFWSRQSGIHVDLAIAWEHKMLMHSDGVADRVRQTRPRKRGRDRAHGKDGYDRARSEAESESTKIQWAAEDHRGQSEGRWTSSNPGVLKAHRLAEAQILKQSRLLREEMDAKQRA